MADVDRAESEERGSSLRLLCKADTEIAEKFLHQLINFICKQRGPQFKDFSSTWNIKEWITICDCWSAIIKCWVGSNVGKEEIKEQLLEEEFSEEWTKRILICITLRKNDIKESMIRQTSAISQSSLKDFDWKVKLVMSSDKLANVREPMADVDFQLQTEDGRRQVSLELNKEEMKTLINHLESANKVVMQLRS
ncbi:COMM domain-containing protein 8-like [Rhopilema esculentum]|uniref:COMM domain-containing protein 8-like n=1 Tax=Rhopilema esculentum TaxID=499914 RepID=UPI0031D4ED5E